MKYFISILILLSFCSCVKEGKIKVRNNVHNVKLESVSWGEYSITYSILTGETSDEVTIRDRKEDFPKSYDLSFYMVNSGKRVYLKTKTKYKLDVDQDLTVIISDTTEVLNPSLP